MSVFVVAVGMKFLEQAMAWKAAASASAAATSAPAAPVSSSLSETLDIDIEDMAAAEEASEHCEDADALLEGTASTLGKRKAPDELEVLIA